MMLKYSRGMLSGYGLASWMNRDYGVLPSPGTVYLKLYSLEEEGLIWDVWQGRRRVHPN